MSRLLLVAGICLALASSHAAANPVPSAVMLETADFRASDPDSIFWEPEIVIDSFAVGDSARFFLYGREYRAVEVSLIPGYVVLINGQPWKAEYNKEDVVVPYDEWVAKADDWWLVPDAVVFAESLMNTGLSEREAGLRFEYERWRLVCSLENIYIRGREAGMTPEVAAEAAYGRIRSLDEFGLVDYAEPVVLEDGDITFEWVSGGLWLEHIPLHTGRGVTRELSYEEWLERDIYPAYHALPGAEARGVANELRAVLADTAGGGYVAIEPGCRFSDDGGNVAARIDAQVRLSREAGKPVDGPLDDMVIESILEVDAESGTDSR